MEEIEKEKFQQCFILLLTLIRKLNKTIEEKDNPDREENMEIFAIYGLGAIDILGILFPEFKEYRYKNSDDDYNDVQAFGVAFKSLCKWADSKGLIPTPQESPVQKSLFPAS